MLFLILSVIPLLVAVIVHFGGKKFKWKVDADDTAAAMLICGVIFCIAVLNVFVLRQYYEYKYNACMSEHDALQEAWDVSGGYAVETDVTKYNRSVAGLRAKQVSWDGHVYFKDNIDFYNVPMISSANKTAPQAYDVYISSE